MACVPIFFLADDFLTTLAGHSEGALPTTY